MQDGTIADNVGARTGKPETTFEEMLNTIRVHLSDLAHSDDIQDEEYKEYDIEHTELGKLSEDDDPASVIGTISELVTHRMVSYRQQQMILDKLTELALRDAANISRERSMMHRTAEMRVLPVVKP